MPLTPFRGLERANCKEGFMVHGNNDTLRDATGDLYTYLCWYCNERQFRTRDNLDKLLLHCALSLAAQCIVIGPVCVSATGGRAVWVCYHDNSKLRASILTKLGL